MKKQEKSRVGEARLSAVPSAKPSTIRCCELALLRTAPQHMLGMGPQRSPLEEWKKTWVKSREGAGPLGRRLAALGEMGEGRTK
jgi:hypothetical protein